MNNNLRCVYTYAFIKFSSDNFFLFFKLMITATYTYSSKKRLESNICLLVIVRDTGWCVLTSQVEHYCSLDTEYMGAHEQTYSTIHCPQLLRFAYVALIKLNIVFFFIIIERNIVFQNKLSMQSRYIWAAHKFSFYYRNTLNVHN